MKKILGILLSCLFIGKIQSFPSFTYRTDVVANGEALTMNAFVGPTMPAEEEEIKIEDTNKWASGELIHSKRKKAFRNRKQFIEYVDNIIDYKRIVVDEKSKLVVVRFYATWCRSCLASEPMFNRLAKSLSSNVKFVEVPLTKENAYLHEGLGIESFPFAHIYHPEAGLVEEAKISKPNFAKFTKALHSYILGYCEVSYQDDDADKESLGVFE